MLRLLALFLVLANAGYLAWSQGWLAGYGFAPAVQAEPHRLTQQLRPEAMRLLSAMETRQLDGSSTTASAASGAQAVSECLQAGPFPDEQAGPLRARLQASLPTGSWSMEPYIEASRWMVYMGKYKDGEMMAIKRSELRRIGVAFDPLTGPAFGPGLSLGRFDSQADAQTALGSLAQRGVRSARVVQERAEVRGQLLTVPAVDAYLRAMLDGLKPQLVGKAWLPCANVRQ
jgi:hypothetical protein